MHHPDVLIAEQSKEDEAMVLKQEPSLNHTNDAALKNEIAFDDDDPDSDNDRTDSSLVEQSQNDQSSNSTSKRFSGSSCHQCKSAKNPSLLLFCSSAAEKGVRKRRCRKKYCDSCLKRSYSPSVAACSADKQSSWVCPSCLGFCVCAACSRSTIDASREGLIEGINQLNQLSPSILALLGVDSAKLCQLQMALCNPAVNPSNGLATNQLGPFDQNTLELLNQVIHKVRSTEQASHTSSPTLPVTQLSHNSRFTPSSHSHAYSMLVEQTLVDPMAASMIADMPNAHAQLGHASDHSANQSWYVHPKSPVPRVTHAEFDSGSALHSAASSASVSPSSVATTHSLSSRSQPVSPSGFSRNLHAPAQMSVHMVDSSNGGSNIGQSLISSNPTMEPSAHAPPKLVGYSNNQMMSQQPFHPYYPDQQWTPMESEVDNRRRGSVVQQPSSDLSEFSARPPSYEIVSHDRAVSQAMMHSSPQLVETRKRAHSACMSETTEDQPMPMQARQRVSPPQSLPRSVSQSRRSSMSVEYSQSRRSSQEESEFIAQREWEMRQLNNQSFNHGLQNPAVLADLEGKWRSRNNRAQTTNYEQMVLAQSMQQDPLIHKSVMMNASGVQSLEQHQVEELIQQYQSLHQQHHYQTNQVYS